MKDIFPVSTPAPCPCTFAHSSILVLCLLGLTGCGQEPDRRFAVFPVDGQLLVDGQPAVGAVVTFHPQGSELIDVVTTATVRDDGHFVPSQADGAVGLPEGPYKLTVVWDDGGSDRFKGRYANPDQPIGEVDVQPSINLLAPIKLSTSVP